MTYVCGQGGGKAEAEKDKRRRKKDREYLYRETEREEKPARARAHARVSPRGKERLTRRTHVHDLRAGPQSPNCRSLLRGRARRYAHHCLLPFSCDSAARRSNWRDAKRRPRTNARVHWRGTRSLSKIREIIQPLSFLALLKIRQRIKSKRDDENNRKSTRKFVGYFDASRLSLSFAKTINNLALLKTEIALRFSILCERDFSPYTDTVFLLSLKEIYTFNVSWIKTQSRTNSR